MQPGSPTPTVTERMARGRRRVVVGATAVFLAAWVAVIGLGQHAHASARAIPAGTTVAPGGSGGSAGYGGDAGGGEDGGWFDRGAQDGSADGGAQPGQADGGGADAPLTTSQS